MGQSRPTDFARSRDALPELLAKGRPVPGAAGEALAAMLGTPVGREGLSKLFQPSFPGIRAFFLAPQATPDPSVEFTVAAIARDGAPLWIGKRALARGNDGSLEIHHVEDEIASEVRSRNLVVDSFRRELELLRSIDAGPSARVTADVEDGASYLFALNGFLFADETVEGPPVRSRRAHDAALDRARLAGALVPLLEQLAKRQPVVSREDTERALHALTTATAPWKIARLELPGATFEIPEGELPFATGLGKAILSSPGLPPWRAALYARPRDFEADRAGEAFRIWHTGASEARFARELGAALDEARNKNRTGQLRALDTLAKMAPYWMVSDITELVNGFGRALQSVGRRAIRQISGTEFPTRILSYADDRTRDPRLRAVAYRTLAEYYPTIVSPRISMLRVDPDARIQRSIVPCLAECGSDPGPLLASLLHANPWSDRAELRVGLLDLRLEIIERLAGISDPRTLPALTAALFSTPAPPAKEATALTHALTSHPDPRARRALAAVAERLESLPAQACL